ncbi:protein tyrosine phosphatase [Paenibacillus sp. LMG 31456]|uniref:Protein tyrosine phosphatase n=1 Tax=Paenibacillus foliorum TaxID=2654974 RepID=A0A972GTF3_9BACL|nr:protein tyrosine phosphatase [Paenibacillus foliorum]NOU95855.1 protein tyrosine phosphatase [Paenibacillus foliorum]
MTNEHNQNSGQAGTSEIGKLKVNQLIDVDNIHVLPKRFRMTTTPIQSVDGDSLNLAGLAELKASGSGMFSQKGLQCMAQTIGHMSITIVDLRQESHGFVNGMAVSWYGPNNGTNKGLVDTEAKDKERLILDGLIASPSIIFDQLEGKSVQLAEPITNPKTIMTEEELVTGEGLGYQRFFVTDHHRPLDMVVDQFIAFVKALPSDTWLHFHCRGGVGRTTSFMLMYDMLRNSGEVSKEDIIQRQIQIGGKDMKSVDPNDTFKYGPAMERLDFIDSFYKYCIHVQEGFEGNWSKWLEG